MGDSGGDLGSCGSSSLDDTAIGFSAALLIVRGDGVFGRFGAGERGIGENERGLSFFAKEGGGYGGGEESNSLGEEGEDTPNSRGDTFNPSCDEEDFFFVEFSIGSLPCRIGLSTQEWEPIVGIARVTGKAYSFESA